MDLIHTLKGLKNSRKTGVPYHSNSSALKTPFETLRKKWDQVPTGASASEKTTNLITLSDEALLAEWEKARRDISPDQNYTQVCWSVLHPSRDENRVASPGSVAPLADGEPRHTSATELPPYATAPRHRRIFTIDFTDHTVRSMHTFGDRASHQRSATPALSCQRRVQTQGRCDSPAQHS